MTWLGRWSWGGTRLFPSEKSPFEGRPVWRCLCAFNRVISLLMETDGHNYAFLFLLFCWALCCKELFLSQGQFVLIWLLLCIPGCQQILIPPLSLITLWRDAAFRPRQTRLNPCGTSADINWQHIQQLKLKPTSNTIRDFQHQLENTPICSLLMAFFLTAKSKMEDKVHSIARHLFVLASAETWGMFQRATK